MNKELYTTDRKSYTIKETGFYWGLFYGTWIRVYVHSLPCEKGNTGSVGFQHNKDYYGKKYIPFSHQGLALQNVSVVYGLYKNKTELLKSKCPIIDSETLIKLGVCELFINYSITNQVKN